MFLQKFSVLIEVSGKNNIILFIWNVKYVANGIFVWLGKQKDYFINIFEKVSNPTKETIYLF